MPWLRHKGAEINPHQNYKAIWPFLAILTHFQQA